MEKVQVIHRPSSTVLRRIAASIALAACADAPAQPKTPIRYPSSFDRGAVAAALGGVSLARCRSLDGPRGSGHLKIVFNPDGTVLSAAVDAPLFAGSAEAECVERKFSEVRIPPFEGEPVPVGKSFVLE